MIKHLSRSVIIDKVKRAMATSPHVSIPSADGRAGILLENLLGIAGGNYDVADAVGFELKTSINPNTPVTLFHKEAQPRGSCKMLVHRFGWNSEYGEEKHPVKSFRATIYGSWTSQYEPVTLNIVANNEQVSIMAGPEKVAFWDSNDLIASAI